MTDTDYGIAATRDEDEFQMTQQESMEAIRGAIAAMEDRAAHFSSSADTQKDGLQKIAERARGIGVRDAIIILRAHFPAIGG